MGRPPGGSSDRRDPLPEIAAVFVVFSQVLLVKGPLMVGGLSGRARRNALGDCV